MVKTFRYIIAGIAAMAAISCAKDGETLVVSNPDPATGLGADPVEKVLLLSEKDNLGMTFNWSNGEGATVSNPSVALPDGLVSASLQFSTSEDFESQYSYSLDADATTVQFTVEALNNIVLRLGVTEENATAVYVRIAKTLGKTTVYSEAVKVTLTPYIGDTGAMSMKDKNSGEVFATLHNTTEHPDRYEGFAVTTTGWQNFYFVASDGTAWGEDTNWTPFVVEKQGDEWRNCWFAGTTGCHYVFLDTHLGEWWQIHFPSVIITVEGKENKMKFSNTAKTWTGTFVTTADNVAVSVGGTGAKYDKTVGTDASATPIDWPFVIVSNENTFSLAEGNAASNLTTGAAGTYTLTFNVETKELSLTSGGDIPEPETYPEKLYAWYYKKEASDKLDKATILNKSDDEGHYHGFIYTSPDWTDEQSGFRFLTSESDDATAYYTNSDQYSLTTDDGGWNLWSSHPGLNYVTVDLTTKTWTETQVKHIAISGDFNDWKIVEDAYMSYNPDNRRWTATCNVNKLEWGIKFVLELEDGDWKWAYGDPDNTGTLTLGKDGFKTPSTGTYKFELNLSSFDAPEYVLSQM